VASGADGLQWNPAGMNELRVPQVEAGHLDWIQGVNDEYASAAFPIYGLGAWGVGASYLYTQDQYFDSVGNPGANFTDFDFSAKAALAVQLPDSMSVGIEYKILRQGYGQQFSMGSGFDLGWQMRDVIRSLDLGAALTDLGTPMAIGTTRENLPIQMKAGAAAHLTPLLTLAVDEEFQPLDTINLLHGGLEYGTRVGDWTGLARVGYTYGPAQADGGLTGLAVGLGVATGSWQLDYAWAPQGDLGQSNRITLTWNAGE